MQSFIQKLNRDLKLTEEEKQRMCKKHGYEVYNGCCQCCSLKMKLYCANNNPLNKHKWS